MQGGLVDIVRRYGTAVVSTLLMTWVRLRLDPALGQLVPFSLFFLAVLLSGWYGGLGPSLLALALGMFAAIYFFIPPHDTTLHIHAAEELVALSVYFVIGAAIAFLTSSQRAAQRRAEEAAQEARRQREELRTTLASIGDAVIVTDADCRVTILNAEAESLSGWTLAQAAGQPLNDVFRIIHEHSRQPGDNPAARALSEGRVVGLANHTLLVARDGTERPIDDSAAPIRDAQGHVLGVVLVFRDVTQQRRTEATLRQHAERLRLALEAGRMGTWDWDLTTGRVAWSPGLEAIHGLVPGTFAGTFDACLQDVHPEDRPFVRGAIAQAVEQRREHHIEYRLLCPDGSTHWMEERGQVFMDDAGKAIHMSGVCIDVTARKRLEHELRLLADASATLADVVDYETTLQKVAWLAVPFFADWCAVDIVEPDGSLRRLALAHADPAEVALADEIHRRFPWQSDAAHGPPQVLRTGKSALITDFQSTRLATVAQDDEHRQLLAQLGLRSAVLVPLQARGKTLGVMTFITAESARCYAAAELALAEELAHRAAIAIENARLYRELREADQRKDEFLAMLAHELRNPLAPIRNALSILGAPGVDGTVTASARALMQRQVHHLVRLVDDLLDVSRLMRGKITLRKERTDLAQVVARAVETAQPLIAAQGHDLTIALPPEPIELEVDSVRLAQVLGNLLANAAKYTESAGRIWLCAEPAPEADAETEGAVAASLRPHAPASVLIRVRDTGIGIAPEMLPRIFDLFMQVDQSLARSQGGLGIGLTLVRNLVEMHGGSVRAFSAGVGHGSEFVVRLPLAPPLSAHEEPVAGAVVRPPPALPRRRILVVDDNVDAAASLAMLLRLQGHEVSVAHDGPAALATAQATQPDVAFLDIGMPGMDGYEVARRVRQQPGLAQVRLVALTGWGQEEDRRRSQAAGFDRHLVKPIEPDVLHGLLADDLGTPSAQGRDS